MVLIGGGSGIIIGGGTVGRGPYIGPREPAASSSAVYVVPGPVEGTTRKFGCNNDIDSGGTFEDIVEMGGTYAGMPDAFGAGQGDTLEVVSTDAADAAAGTGARTVQIYGLDEDGVEVDETITLNGVTAVDTTAATWARCWRAVVRSAGSGATAAGTISVVFKTKYSTPTCVSILTTAPGYNQTMIAAWTVPAGKVARIVAWGSAFANGSNGDSTVLLRARPDGEVWQVKEQAALKGGSTTWFHRPYPIPGEFAALTDIKITANSDTNNAVLAAWFDVVTEDA